MEFRLINLCSPHPAELRKLLIVFLAFVPALAVQNCNGPGDDHPLLQCTNAVSRCLFNYSWNMSDTQCCHPNACPKDCTDFTNELRAAYGKIIERLDGLSEVQPELLQHIKDLTMQLNECKENLADLQHDAKQLCECKETLANCQSDVNGLRLLVRERYTEYDVVQAVRQSDLNKLRLLLDAGLRADSRDKGNYNNTALHVACLKGHLELIRFLVKRGAPLEARNTDNNTCLFDAVVGNHLPAVQLMIELGANPVAKGWHGETPRERAERAGFVGVAKWLEENGW